MNLDNKYMKNKIRKKIIDKKEIKREFKDILNGILEECKDRHNDFIHIDKVYDAVEDAEKEVSRLVF